MPLEAMLKQRRRIAELGSNSQKVVKTLNPRSAEEMFFLQASSYWDVPEAFLELSVV